LWEGRIVGALSEPCVEGDTQALIDTLRLSLRQGDEAAPVSHALGIACLKQGELAPSRLGNGRVLLRGLGAQAVQTLQLFDAFSRDRFLVAKARIRPK